MASGVGQGPTSGLVSAAFLTMLFRSILKISGMGIFLSGLHTFRCQPDAAAGAQSTLNASGNTKKERKLAASRSDLTGLVGAGGVVMHVVGPLSLSRLAFSKDFDHLVRGRRMALVGDRMRRGRVTGTRHG